MSIEADAVTSDLATTDKTSLEPSRVGARHVVGRIRSELASARDTRIYEDYANALRLISQVVFTRSSNFILEFLQNAEDAGLGLSGSGTFDIYIDDTQLRIVHNGRPFTARDVESICGIRSLKRPERGTLGYLGIGFKSVFKVTDAPEIHSGPFHFKFDKAAATEAKDLLWQVTPVWVDEASESINGDTTTFVIPFSEPAHQALVAEEMTKFGPHLYLFLRWIKRIRIIDEATSVSRILENHGTDGANITTVSDGSTQHRFRIFRARAEVPEDVKADVLTQNYRSGVSEREVAVAFALDSAFQLTPVPAMASYGGVYSFVPIGESKTGAPFPIQADFLVQPGRDALNYEARWNHWLTDEIAGLCERALMEFAEHETWRYQFLPVFSFDHSPGAESYDKLFGPHLIKRLEAVIASQPLIPTLNGARAGLTQVVRFNESEQALEDLLETGLIAGDHLAEAFGSSVGATLVDPLVRDGKSLIRRVDRWGLLQNEELLRAHAADRNAAVWFRSLYRWLREHPVLVKKGRRTTIHGYHDYEIVLTERCELVRGGSVFTIDELGESNAVLVSAAAEWRQDRPLLHHGVMAGSDEEQLAMRGFLTGYTGVQLLGVEKLCRDAVLPRILTTTSPPPAEDELLAYSRCCFDILGSNVRAEIWVLTGTAEIRAAREVLIGSGFAPDPDWEENAVYIPGLSFVSPRYIAQDSNEDTLAAWRAFFISSGVKVSPDNGVEVFAMNFVENHLRSTGFDPVPVDKQNYGYDMEASLDGGRRVRIEVKGQLRDKDSEVELTGNETTAAKRYGEDYWLAIVSRIPERPMLCRIVDPERVGDKDKIRIPVATWREARWI